MISLSVNVNKIATLRNARGGQRPTVTGFARAAVEAGAHGITVHPRPDERHIRHSDVFELADLIAELRAADPDAHGDVEYNIEGYPDRRYIDLVGRIRPTQATLVPDPPDVLTSDAGWDTVKHQSFLHDVIAELQAFGTRVSLFLEPQLEKVEAAATARAHRIELYTGPYAEAHDQGDGETSYRDYERAALHAIELGLGLNAGHDLDLDNLLLFRRLPGLQEVSIGHALTCDALERGWRPTVEAYLRVLRGADESR